MNLIYFKHAMIQRKYAMLQMKDYQGDEIQKGIERFYSCDVL